MTHAAKKFASNAWYVAARAEELGEALLARSIIGLPVVLYRKADGSPCALLDACAHRLYPLSKGFREGDEIRCSYHGFKFDPLGQCTHIPSSEHIPEQAKVRSFPLVERYDMAWIWMGDPELADPSLIPDCHWLNTGNKVFYYVHLQADYQLLIENLLDFSHVPFVHADQQGHPELARVVPETEMAGRTVVSKRLMRGSITPSLWADVMGLRQGQPMDHDQVFIFNAPSSVCIRQKIWASGAEDAAYPFSTSHFMTPDGDGATHYWSWVSLEWNGVSPASLERMDVGAREVAQQDVVALQAQQRTQDQLRRHGERPVIVSVPFDRGSLLSRRAIASLLD
ncbi:MAG: aromatic ring-hydroxylating dioxygenase subunit alpha [Pigmentiphaga sp.]|nr:aromatic ring-hydroxylating dioxygenase subunit alpha [Pigmentiphaga sp.]